MVEGYPAFTIRKEAIIIRILGCHMRVMQMQETRADNIIKVNCRNQDAKLVLIKMIKRVSGQNNNYILKYIILISEKINFLTLKYLLSGKATLEKMGLLLIWFNATIQS